jgi:glutamate-1-semialdehyde aminotransferase
MMTLFFMNQDRSIHQHVLEVTPSGGKVARSTATSSSGNSFAGKITDWATASTHCDTGRYAKYFWGMLERGYYFPCSQFETFFMSTEITEQEIEQTITAAGEVFKTL